MSTHATQKIKASFMRGGTSKGIFFALHDLPASAQIPGPERDAIWLRTIGSPDPYGKQIDGMGAGSSSTSKAVLISPSQRPEHDVEYLFGQVSIDQPWVDWSGNCGNLSAAVGPFAIENGLIDAARLPRDGSALIRIWQANTGKTILAHVPMQAGSVQETGDFELDGVTFPAAEIVLEFLDPSPEEPGAVGGMFPTGQRLDELCVPGLPPLQATFISAGIPTIFLRADQLGLSGSELQEQINSSPEWLAKFELLRAHGALKMGLISALAEAKTRQHTPKIAFVAPPADYLSASGKTVAADSIDLRVRALSMGKLHHAMMGTCAVAIAAAAAVPGTVVSDAAGKASDAVCFGHPSGIMRAGATAQQIDGEWRVSRAVMSRSARVLMEGNVRVVLPA